MSKKTLPKNYEKKIYEYQLVKFERALAFQEALQKEFLDAEKNKNEILKRFERCIGAAQVDAGIYDYLFRYLGIKIDKTASSVTHIYNKTAANEISKWAAKFVENVFPQDAENFLILATEKCIDALSVLYPEYPRNEVENRINQILREITTLISSTINNGKFFSFFLDEVKVFFVRQFDCMIAPSNQNFRTAVGNVVYKPIPPMSIGYDYNDENDVIGVFRRFTTTFRNAVLSYPDFNTEVFNEDEIRPDKTLCFRECCFLKFIDTLNEFRWVYILFSEGQKIVVFRLLKFNPFLTFCETMPYGSTVGRGMFFNCYSDVKRAEGETKLLEDVLEQNAKPSVECVVGKITNLDELNGTLKNGQILKVSEPNVVRPISMGERPDLLATQVTKTEEDIRNAFSSERYEPEKSDTATAVTVNVSREVAFLSSHYGKVLKTFIDQLVSKTLFSLEETNDIYDCLVRFFREDPMNRLPLSVFTNDVLAEPELMNEMLDYFVNTLIDLFLDIRFLHIKVLSNLGLKQRYDDINRFVGMLQMFSGVSNLPPSAFFSFDKFLDKTINSVGMDRGVFLNEKERREIQNSIAMAAEQNVK
jgi:Bacteriophage head to tail connecting protein.